MVNVYDKYVQKLVSEGVVTPEYVKELEARQLVILEQGLKNAKKEVFDLKSWQFNMPLDIEKTKKGQGVDLDRLTRVGELITQIPKDFNAHKQIQKIYQLRQKSIQERQGIDYATAEALGNNL